MSQHPAEGDGGVSPPARGGESWFDAPIAGGDPSARASLDGDEVHLWRADLGLHALQARSFLMFLSSDEKERAARFRFSRDRDRFVAARGLLRTLLGQYLEMEPDQIRFSYGPWGKPSLTAGLYGKDLRFNLSHAHGLAVFAVTLRREVGIDLELVQPELPWEPIARRFLPQGELAELLELQERSRSEAFFRSWTRREALSKATGAGSSLPAELLEMARTPEGGRVYVTLGKDSPEARAWTTRELHPGYGYVAALAVEGSVPLPEAWRQL